MLNQETMLQRLDLERIGQCINQRYGLEFCHRQLDLLGEAVEKRCKANGSCTLAQYQDLLQREEESLQLIQLLAVHETYFFREAAQFDVMRQHVMQRIAQEKERPLLRFLSAGCSTGEEAYSIAMALLDIAGVGAEWDFEVIGVDVDPAAIRKAQLGNYGPYSFRGCSMALRSRYFKPLGSDRFVINETIKEKVRFEVLNLFEPDYPEWLKKIDVVFYRNVSIYFSKLQRAQLFNRLSGLLASAGCLFVSCTETLYHDTQQMELVNSGDVFYYRKKDATKLSPAKEKEALRARPCRTRPKRPEESVKWISKPLLPERHEAVKRIERLHADPLATVLEMLKDKQYDEAIASLDRWISCEPLCTKAYTLKANVLLNRQCIEEAEELCHTVLVMDVFCLEAYLLLGMAAKIAGKCEEAIQRFKKAVYVSPECWLAHFFLAQLYQLRKEDAYARREYQVVMRILEQGGFAEHGLSFFLLAVQLDDLIRLCRHQIDGLRE
ncbi:CheR family methyltransferase [Azotosporobacter soli]|uniref:CheR family methyltransferase n=1 Tax=Azotosporobacter soli TaxID=3055040 RepID=UPI0031FE92F5